MCYLSQMWNVAIPYCDDSTTAAPMIKICDVCVSRAKRASVALCGEAAVKEEDRPGNMRLECWIYKR
jgi:hypothetical protein